MKKIIAFFALFLFMFSVAAFAQTAKIIETKGDVQVKKEANSAWKKAKINTFLDKQAEIKTGVSAECTLTFDEEFKNILTIKENSQIKLENLKPVDISLPKGRVFSLIEDIAKVEKFEIRTPTAIAGVRGTGESVEFSSGCANVKCFENNVYVQGLTNQGDTTGERGLTSGFGVKACEGGTLGEQFALSKEDLLQWEEFLSNVDDLRDNSSVDDGEGDSLNDALDERRLDYGDDNLEDRRRDEENSHKSSSSDDSDGRYDK
ncbi:MAG: FecR family protein [Candidatus Omnitrophica bacterium]|jgi:aspartate carbamoyltransferase regulatory subunit|nr:FecR family protein [Candidatus Omnitrophota bacterium]